MADNRQRAILALVAVTVAAIAAIAIAWATPRGDEDGAAPTSTTTFTTTSMAAGTTQPDYSAAVAGLLTPPAGVTQDQADAFAADLTTALTEAGWPELERQASIDLLQQGLDIGATGCQLLDASTGLGTDAVDGMAQYATTSLLPDLTTSIEATGVPPDTASGLARGFLTGTYDAAGRRLCPQHAQALTDATRGL